MNFREERSHANERVLDQQQRRQRQMRGCWIEQPTVEAAAAVEVAVPATNNKQIRSTLFINYY
jgi:hypothetical protein